MGKKKGEPEMREWIVPMEFTVRGLAYVKAISAEEAEVIAKNGDHDHRDFDETIDWSVTGTAKVNE